MYLAYKNIIKPRFGLAFVAAALLCGASVAEASERDRLNRLEADVETLSRAVYSGKSPLSSGASAQARQQADAEIRAQQLEMELRKLTGTIEEQSYQIRQLKNQLDRSMSDLVLRVQDLERSSTSSASAASIPSASRNVVVNSDATPKPVYNNNASRSSVVQSLGSIPSKPQPIVKKTQSLSVDQAAADYENAFAMLKASNFAGAEKEFDAFLKKYPSHVLVPNAKYWHGETFYVRGKYERAARIFAEAYQSAPKGSKAPDNLLKLGMSLAGIGNKEDACVALGQLNKTNVSGSNPVLRRAEQEMSRLGC